MYILGVMTTRIHKIGNSLGVYIPKQVAQKTGLIAGLTVSVRPSGRKIIVEPENQPETLKDLLKSVNARNRHALIDFGSDIGAEVVD